MPAVPTPTPSQTAAVACRWTPCVSTSIPIRRSPSTATAVFATAAALRSLPPAPTPTAGTRESPVPASASIRPAPLPTQSRAPTATDVPPPPRSQLTSRHPHWQSSAHLTFPVSQPQRPLAVARSRQTPARPLPPEVYVGAHRTIPLSPAAIPPTEPARAPSPAASQDLPRTPPTM